MRDYVQNKGHDKGFILKYWTKNFPGKNHHKKSIMFCNEDGPKYFPI